MAKFKFRAVNLHKSAHFRLFSFVALRVFATLWHFSFLDFVSFSLDFAPTMATIIKRGSKRKLTDVSERESKMKIRRKVYLEVEKIKAEGKTRGIYSIVARQLAITDDQARNYYKSEEKKLKQGGSSSEEYIILSGGEPTTMVYDLSNVFISTCIDKVFPCLESECH